MQIYQDQRVFTICGKSLRCRIILRAGVFGWSTKNVFSMKFGRKYTNQTYIAAVNCAESKNLIYRFGFLVFKEFIEIILPYP